MTWEGRREEFASLVPSEDAIIDDLKEDIVSFAIDLDQMGEIVEPAIVEEVEQGTTGDHKVGRDN